MSFLLHDPDTDLDYSIDWSTWMVAGDAISTSTWSISPTGPTLVDNGTSGDIATVFLSAATRGATYILTNEILTTSNRTENRSITIRCDIQ